MDDDGKRGPLLQVLLAVLDFGFRKFFSIDSSFFCVFLPSAASVSLWLTAAVVRWPDAHTCFTWDVDKKSLEKCKYVCESTTQQLFVKEEGLTDRVSEHSVVREG